MELAGAGVASPLVDARVLAEHLLGRQVLLADGAGADFLPAYRALVARRAAREPLQHLTGRMWFRGLELVARPGVFIVRPETEVVAGAAIEEAQQVVLLQGRAPVVVDLCTGSGAIAIAVAAEVPAAQVVAVELADGPFAAAGENCERLVPGRVRLIQADAIADGTLSELDGSVDVVVSNPPYVPAEVVEDPETALHDPVLALYGGGEEGLEIPRAVVARASRMLRPGGVLVMEHDAGQGAALRETARAVGMEQVRTGQDLTGRDRYLLAMQPFL
ncbi:peptide chain release factor N(5)-glutamine methyltransferase [Actinomyces faecalis]|uniref:peptide chain release factor N(5)-glutamine methyltransferase n=1 Tax=Actinomyces faecalis TaxID=2722820 RepID=UPI001554F7FD|nr:peptide chain release factor N(5)-glutamine methyltransferase [Actinomyces faecalis]